jgi:hypothetical protein
MVIKGELFFLVGGPPGGEKGKGECEWGTQSKSHYVYV